MIRIALKAREVRALESALRGAKDPRFCRRVQAVLMTHRGRARADVAADLGVTPRTVQRHLNAYLDRGLDGLRPGTAPGPAPRLTDDLADDVRAWVAAGPAACGLAHLANWTFEALADHLAHTRGVRVRKSAMHAFCRRHGVRPYRPTYRYLRGDPARQAAAARALAGLKKARRGELILLAQDEARCPMVPTLCATLGVKGRRPVVGTRDDKDLLHVFASVNCVDGRLHTLTLGTRARALRAARLAGRRRAVTKTRRMTDAFAAHVRRVAAAYPAARHPRVVLVIDNAPWHRGAAVTDALAAHPHVELYRLPAYSPQLNAIERLWRVLRRRSTHNRLFDDLADLKRAVRAGLRYLQRARRRVTSLIGKCYDKRTVPSGT